MGWTFSTRDGFDKAALVAELTAPTRYAPGYVGLQHKVVGNNLWTLLQCPDGSIMINLDLMESGYPQHGWGWKNMDESCGPCEKDCPLSFLDRCTPPTSGYAKDWREKVRQYHAKQAARPAPVAGLVLVSGGHTYRLVKPVAPRKGWEVERLSDGAHFRMKAPQLARALDNIPSPDPVAVEDTPAPAEITQAQQLDLFGA